MHEELREQVHAAEKALKPGGILHAIAEDIARPDAPLTTADAVADVLLPPKDGSPQPRWMQQEGLTERRKELYAANASAIYDIAHQAGIRQQESLPAETVQMIGERAVFVVESGANRTPVVRHSLAEDASSAADTPKRIYDLSGSRTINPKRADGSPNPEHKIARSLAPNFLPEDEGFTEFDVRVAVAKERGYTAPVETDNVLSLFAPGEANPEDYTRHIVKPTGNLQEGISRVDADLKATGYGGFDRMQPVIATNGQYRTAKALLADEWMRSNTRSGYSPVVIGDEAGYTVNNHGEQFVTANRAPGIYVPELVIIHRIAERIRQQRQQ